MKFVGPIKQSEGVWYGVELDKRNGKHGGTVKDVRYFVSKPMHGICCRLDQLSLYKNPNKGVAKSSPNLLRDDGDAPIGERRGDSALVNSHGKLETSGLAAGVTKERKSKVGFHEEERKSNVRDLSIDPEARKAKFTRGKTIKILLDDKAAGGKGATFAEDYDYDEIEDELGDGEFGTVYKCRSRKNKYLGKKNKYYAVKKIKKSKLHHISSKDQSELITRLREEIQLLKRIRRQKRKKLTGYRYLVHFKEVYEDRNYLYIVTNLCKGGNLWDRIENSGGLTERHCQKIMRESLEGLLFLSNYNIAHLDLKPENIMFSTRKADWEIQIIDFGMSRIIPRLKKQRALAGTPHFLAPEVIQGHYDVKADVWSMGVILFLLLFGYPPFFDDEPDELGLGTLKNDNEAIYSRICEGFRPIVMVGHGNWFPKEKPVSPEVQDLIKQMLQIDLGARITVKEALDHPWFKTQASDKKLDFTVQDAFSRFSTQCKFRVLISKLFAYKVSDSDQKRLKDVFLSFDKNNDGKISMKEFKKGMMEYKLGYTPEQLEAMFSSLSLNEKEIDFNAFLTAFSYQRLVASDERLYEAFRELDKDDDGHVTKAELIAKLEELEHTGMDSERAAKAKKLLGMGGKDEKKPKKGKGKKEKKIMEKPSLASTKDVSAAMGYADVDRDGEIDVCIYYVSFPFFSVYHPKNK